MALEKWAFLGRARGDFHEGSDFDFLYSTGGNPLSYTAKIAAEEDLQKTLGADVDLVDDRHVIARMRPRIRKELQVVYEG